jgi:hypothetical protein
MRANNQLLTASGLSFGPGEGPQDNKDLSYMGDREAISNRDTLRLETPVT